MEFSKNVVDDDVVVVTIKKDFTFGDFQTTADHIVRLQHPRFQPPLQFLKRWRQYENRCRVADLLFHLSGSLDIDVENDVLACSR